MPLINTWHAAVPKEITLTCNNCIDALIEEWHGWSAETIHFYSDNSEIKIEMKRIPS